MSLPLVIRYEAVEVEGSWGVLQRIVVRDQGSHKLLLHHGSSQELAWKLCEAMQHASDCASEEWRAIVAEMDRKANP